MNVLVMGAGGVGGYFGALLARAGHDVTVVARGPHLDAIKRDGLRVERATEPSFAVAVDAATAVEPGYEADLVLFAVKTYDLDPAVRVIEPAIGRATTVLAMQNGVGSGERLAERFGPERVLDAAVYVEAHLGSPGVIVQEGTWRVVFGRRAGNGGAETALLERFADAGWEAELSPQILATLWTKLTFIGPLAALGAIAGLSAAQVCSQDASTAFIEAVVDEYAAVGNAVGAGLPADVAAAVMERVRGFEGITSMHRDRLAGKRLESDALVGDVVRRGAAHGVPTPLTAGLDALLAPMRDGGAAAPAG